MRPSEIHSTGAALEAAQGVARSALEAIGCATDDCPFGGSLMALMQGVRDAEREQSNA